MALVLCIVVVAVAGAVLVAWLYDWTALLSIEEGWIPTRPVTAGALIVLAGAVGLQARDRRGGDADRRGDGLSTALAVAVAAAGVATLFEHSFGISHSFERLFPIHPADPRMAPSTALSMTLLGSGVALLLRRPRWAQGLVLAAAIPPYVALIGYAARAAAFYQLGSSTAMAATTGLCLLALVVAALAVTPGGFLHHLETATEADAVVARVAIPVTVAAPPIIAGITTALSATGVLNDELRLAVTVAAQVCINLTLVVFLAARLRHLDTERRATAALAEADPVTGIGNRRAFERIFQDWAQNPASSLGAVLIVDLDNFKQVNDTWGHPTGDRVLAHFVGALSTVTRAQDLLVRLGGDEFGVFLPDADVDVAHTVAERIVTVACDQARFVPEAQGVGASVGVTQCQPGADTLATALARADHALYQAKTAGKGRVAAYNATHPAGTLTPTDTEAGRTAPATGSRERGNQERPARTSP